MKPALHLRQSQHLALTPQLQQSIRLLQLSTPEFNQELEKFLQENPLLERDDNDGQDAPDETVAKLGDDGLPERIDMGGNKLTDQLYGDNNERQDFQPTQIDAQDDIRDEYGFGGERAGEFGDQFMRGQSGGDDERNFNDVFGQTQEAGLTLQQHLLQQLPLTSLSTRDRQIAAFLIVHLDDDGYLTYDMDDLVELLQANSPADDGEGNWSGAHLRDELNIALRHIQHLDPTGVGARSLSECLDLQIEALPAVTPYRLVARALVKDHLDVLAQRDFVKLKKLLRLSDEELKTIRALIVSLDPKPGRVFGVSDIRYIVPDVIVKKVRGRWRASLNEEAMPKLRVNKFYANLIQKSRDADGKGLSGQLQEARWLVKNIQQRFETILKVTEAIVENQRHFFDHGEVAMRPLVLREIAEQVGLHESTISRVTTQKYMLTPRGVFELKYFFGSSVATESGGACSATAIRALIKQLVEAEDDQKPLSDSKIVDVLSAQGILVARRTIAKYRESMHIQPASLRKSL